MKSDETLKTQPAGLCTIAAAERQINVNSWCERSTADISGANDDRWYRQQTNERTLARSL